VGLAPGIAEELLCRGLVQRWLEPRLGGALAVLAGGLFFGALHVDPVHAGLAAVLGVYLGAIALRTGSVRAPIACHVLNNTVAVVSAARLPEEVLGGVAGAVSGFAVAALCLWRATRAGEPRPAPAGAPPETQGGLQPGADSDDP
jgi:membrane protease YdiL (CAAX protease family)